MRFHYRRFAGNANPALPISVPRGARIIRLLAATITAVRGAAPSSATPILKILDGANDFVAAYAAEALTGSAGDTCVWTLSEKGGFGISSSTTVGTLNLSWGNLPAELWVPPQGQIVVSLEGTVPTDVWTLNLTTLEPTLEL